MKNATIEKTASFVGSSQRTSSNLLQAHLFYGLRQAVENLMTSKIRSFLTVLGVIMGVASVIATISIGQGTQTAVTRSMERLGTNLIFVWPDDPTWEENRPRLGNSPGLVFEDGEAVKNSIPSVEEVVSIAEFNATIQYGSRSVQKTVEGMGPAYGPLRNFYPQKGRFIEEEDVRQWRRVVVLGQEMSRRIFGTEDPIGKEIKLNSERFTVVGVMELKGQTFGTNYDRKVMIPVTTALRRFKGSNRVDSLLIKARSRELVEETKKQIHEILKERHDQVIDFRVRAQEEFRKTLDQTVGTFQWMIGSVAVVSLLVGGVGIMNIMLMTINERTREIGLRKAMGANHFHIFSQFLIESVLVSLFGGLLGIGAGTAVGNWVSQGVKGFVPGGVDVQADISFSSILIAFSFALITGILFGLYPAWRASRLDPAEALRQP